MALDVDIALTTVEDVASELGVEVADLSAGQIAFIERRIMAASQAVATWLGYPLGFASVTEAPQSLGWPRIFIGRGPVFAVNSISAGGVVVDADDYIVRSGNQIIEFGRFGVSVGGGNFNTFSGSGCGCGSIAGGWPSDLGTADPALLSITYQAGWVLPGQDPADFPAGAPLLPADIQQAVILAVVDAYNSRGQDRSIISERLMSESTTYRDTTLAVSGGVPGFPADASAMLAPYRSRYQY